MTPEERSLGVGASVLLTAVPRDEGGRALDRPVRWESSHPERAPVDSVGRVHGLEAGGVVITASSQGVVGRAQIEVLQFASLTAGGGHTCGLTVEGTAYCWGWGPFGQLGNGGTDDESTPVPVAGEHAFATISAAGGAHTCALTREGGAYCWGQGELGQLVRAVSGSGDGPAHSAVPLAVSEELTFTSLSSGGLHTCGLAGGGEAYCWGHGGYGQVGDGHLRDRFEPVSVVAGREYSNISAGGLHTCGVTPAGEAHCRGHGEFGQVGDGGEDDRWVPAPVGGGMVLSSLTAGGRHTCGMCREGRAYCWGWGHDGQLGNGSTADRVLPGPV